MDSLLGMITDGTRVDQNDVGFIDVLSELVATTVEDPANYLGVRHIHLTAVGLYVDLLGHPVVYALRRE